jgi:hypothetical protein
VIVASTGAATAFVRIVNAAVLTPAAIVTAGGTVIEELLLDRITNAPPDGAPLESVIMPLAGVPPTTDGGVTAIAVSTAASGVTFRTAVRVVPAADAAIVTSVGAVTDVVVMVNVAVVWFAAIVTPAGTVTIVELADNAMASPPGGAIDVRTTVP